MTLEESQRQMRQAIKDACQQIAMTVHTGGPKSFGGALQFAGLCAFVRPVDMWCDAKGDLLGFGMQVKDLNYILDFSVGMTAADGKREVFDGHRMVQQL